jgi:hypothetical protein
MIDLDYSTKPITESPALLATALLRDLDNAGLPTSYTFERISAWDPTRLTWSHRVGTVLPDDSPYITYFAFRIERDDSPRRGEIDSSMIPSFGITLPPHTLRAASAAVLHLYGRIPAALWIDDSPAERERKAAEDFERLSRAAAVLQRQAETAGDAAEDACLNSEDPARIEILLSRAYSAARQLSRMESKRDAAAAELPRARQAAILAATQTKLF